MIVRRTLAVVATALGCAASHPASAGCVLGKVAEMPVTMRGSKPTVTASVNGRAAVFILDTGAFYSVVSEEAALSFGMQPRLAPQGMRIGGLGGADSLAKVARADTFQFAGASYKNVEFLVAARAGAGEIAGLLGQNLLGYYDMEYDLANGYLRFFKPTNCADANLAYWAASETVSQAKLKRTQVKRTDGKILPSIITSAEIDGHPIKAHWDSGASTTYLNRAAAARAGVHPTSESVVSAGLTYGLFGQGQETVLASFGSLTIGGETIRTPRLRVVDIDVSGADMLLGVDFFLSHRILISNSQGQAYFTYNGGGVFGADQTPAHAGDAPTPDGQTVATAAELGRRASAWLARGDVATAIADLSKAIELEPNEASHYKERARARAGRGEPALAIADLSEAIKLKPDDSEALLTRGALHLRANDEPRARQDFEAAKAQAKPGAGHLLFIGQTYSEAGHYELALREFSAWLAANPDDRRAPTVLNARCWSRALWGRELEGALADCEEAIRKGGRNSDVMDSRGMVLLRLGRFDEAIAQYDAALKLQPKAAWSLYGRGLAKLRKGNKGGGEADLAAAIAIRPDIAKEARRLDVATEAETKL